MADGADARPAFDMVRPLAEGRFITASHPDFAACMHTSFANFVREPANSLPSELHDGFRACLHGLQASDTLARHDVHHRKLEPIYIPRVIITS